MAAPCGTICATMIGDKEDAAADDVRDDDGRGVERAEPSVERRCGGRYACGRSGHITRHEQVLLGEELTRDLHALQLHPL